MPVNKSDTISNHIHNLARSYRGLKLLLSDTKFMTTINSMLNSL